ncbi:ParB/RepB/Spo0J family partition protein [Jatrophihabitans sp. DSM 45814]
MTITITDIEIGLVHPHKANPRHDATADAELVKSIKSSGIQQPLTVAPSADNFGYTLIDGHRRIDAARQAKLATVPCLIREELAHEPAQIEAMLIAGLRRRNLSPVEEGEAYQLLLTFPDYTAAMITKATGTSAKSVKQRLQIAEMPDAAKAKIHDGQLSLGDAVKLAPFVDEPEVFEKLSQSVGTGNFQYNLADANKRRKAIAAAIEAGAEIISSRAAMYERYPNAMRLTREDEVGPGVVLIYPPNAYYSEYFKAEPEQAERDQPSSVISADDDAHVSNAGGSMVEKGRAKKQREQEQADWAERERLKKIRETATAARLEFCRDVVSTVELKTTDLEIGLRGTFWNLVYEGENVTLDLLGVPKSDDVDGRRALGRQITDKMSLASLVLALVLTQHLLFSDPILGTRNSYRDLDEYQGARTYMDFLAGQLWYQPSDVDLEQLAAVDERIAELTAAVAGSGSE